MPLEWEWGFIKATTIGMLIERKDFQTKIYCKKVKVNQKWKWKAHFSSV